MPDTKLIKEEVEGLMSDTRKWHSKREFSNLNKEEFIAIMQTKYEYLYTNSNTLFMRSIVGDLNLQHLDFMLGMLEKVNQGKDYQKVSQEVGQRLVDVYVKPLIEKKE